jgi:hypothetical protein
LILSDVASTYHQPTFIIYAKYITNFIFPQPLLCEVDNKQTNTARCSEILFSQPNKKQPFQWAWNWRSEIYYICKKRILPTNESGSCVPIPTIRSTSLWRLLLTTKPVWDPLEHGCFLLRRWVVDRSSFGWEQPLMLLSKHRARSSRYC